MGAMKRCPCSVLIIHRPGLELEGKASYTMDSPPASPTIVSSSVSSEISFVMVSMVFLRVVVCFVTLSLSHRWRKSKLETVV